jgi:DNA primase large subunit
VAAVVQVTSRLLPSIAEEERLMPMLSNLSRQYLGQDYTNRKAAAGQITADMLDSVTYAVCMLPSINL